MTHPTSRLSALARLLVISLAVAPAVASAFTPLHDGDRVVFYGDSITEQRLYTRYLQQFVAVRYPKLDVHFFNAGWGGDTAPGALRRLERDVLILKPTVVTLFFGMNDGHYKKLEQATLAEYRTAMVGLIERMQQDHIRVILYTPGAVDYDNRPALRDCDYNATLKALGDVCRELGQKYQCEVIDVQTPMLDFQAGQKKRDPKFTMIPDAIHPSPLGHLVMARAMLPALAEPVEAAGSVDAATGQASPTGSGKLAVTHDGDEWRVDVTQPTPFWVEPDSRDGAAAANIDRFVWPSLVVRNLPAGTYQVAADDGAAVSFTAEQLAAGVALPMNTSAGEALHNLIHVKEDAYFAAWRQLRVPMAGLDGVGDAVDASMTLDEKLVAAIRAAARKDVTTHLSIRRGPDGPNLALGKPYESSDPNGFGWGIGGLTDGSWEASPKHCFATGDKDAFPKTATIDLGSQQTIGQVIIGIPPFGSTKTVIVSVSEDGKTFKDVGQNTFTQRKSERKVFTFEPAAARYIRLTYPDHYPDEVNYSATFTFTTEVEAYGPQAAAHP